MQKPKTQRHSTALEKWSIASTSSMGLLPRSRPITRRRDTLSLFPRLHPLPHNHKSLHNLLVHLLHLAPALQDSLILLQSQTIDLSAVSIRPPSILEIVVLTPTSNHVEEVFAIEDVPLAHVLCVALKVVFVGSTAGTLVLGVDGESRWLRRRWKSEC